jgi:hypothetical protein
MDGQLSDSSLNTYKSDFLKMLGWGREGNALKNDGENIIAARDQGIPVPDDLQNATDESAANYLRNRSILRVPDDHVMSIRSKLREEVLNFPENFFLESSPSEIQINTLLDRVKGIGLSSSELIKILET